MYYLITSKKHQNRKKNEMKVLSTKLILLGLVIRNIADKLRLLIYFDNLIRFVKCPIHVNAGDIKQGAC